MEQDKIDKIFTFHPNTAEQDAATQDVYNAAHHLAKLLQKHLPEQHAQQAILQLAGIVNIARQGIQLDARESKLMLV